MAEEAGAGAMAGLEHPGWDPAAGEEFLREALRVLLEDAVRKGTDVTEKVCEWREPPELRDLLDLELRSRGEPPERLLQRCRDVVRYSVKTGHPRFFNQLFSGLDPHALAGRLLTEALNTSQYTFEVAPVFVLMEGVVLAKLRELVGWSSGDGIFAPGGSICNMYAMNVARFQRFPECRSLGMAALPRLALFTSCDVRAPAARPSCRGGGRPTSPPGGSPSFRLSPSGGFPIVHMKDTPLSPWRDPTIPGGGAYGASPLRGVPLSPFGGATSPPRGGRQISSPSRDAPLRGVPTIHRDLTPPLPAQSHYSIQKGAAFLGIGTDNVRLVATDERGKMIPEELEKEIQKAKAEGAEPFLVCATCGTTVLGAFDPLGAIADVCERHGLWLHVDAAWGGSALLSSKHRHLLAGIERAHSVTWNPHKMLTVGLQCSAFLLRDTSGLLQRCHGSGATYLFQRDKFYDMSYDTGDKSLQCGRRVDCLKLWLLWKATGTQGLAQRVERAFACSRYLAEEVKRRDGFKLVMEPEFINLCFWFVPPSLRGRESCPDYWSSLGKVAPTIKERMMRKGSMMVGYQPHGTRVNFFRQIVTSPAVTRADLDFFLDEIERLGWDL